VPVQDNKIETDILDHLRSIRLDRKSRIAEDVSPEVLATKGLSKEKGLHIICFNAEGKAIAHLIRGADASGGGQWSENQVRGFYVRPRDRNDVILYEPQLGYWYLGLQEKDWIDLTVHNFPGRDVERFTVRNARGAVSLVREESDGTRPLWRVEAGPEGVGELRQEEVSNILQRFNFINCTRYVGRIDDPAWADKVPGDDAKIMVSATLKDGSVYTMWLGDKIPGTQEYYGRFANPSGPNPFLLAIGEWDRTPFEKDPKALFEPAPVQPPAGGAPDPAKKEETGGGNGGEQGDPDDGGETPTEKSGDGTAEKANSVGGNEPAAESGSATPPSGEKPKGS
jgi:hypothetical protein